MSITKDKKTLHRLLQQALEVELFTIPPYLTALYSIREGTNRASVQIIQSVVMEEMLHAVLVANLMNAIGAKPQLEPGTANGLPKKEYYPAQLPHMSTPLVVGLKPFSKEAIASFRDIEKPDDETCVKSWARTGSVTTIGELYDKIRNKLIELVELYGAEKIFIGDRAYQFSSQDYYGGGGRLTTVECLHSALAAIEEISQQGEGRVHLSNLTGDELRFKQPKEVAHYYRFLEILNGRYYDRDDDILAPTGPRFEVDWTAAQPTAETQNGTMPNGPEGLELLWKAFEDAYLGLLKKLHTAFNGNKASLGDAIPAMQALKVSAIELMRVELPDGGTCPPPFWYLNS